MTANLAPPEVMARIQYEDLGAIVEYCGLIDDIVATGLVDRAMIPVDNEDPAGYFRGRRELGKPSHRAGSLIIVRLGPLVRLRFWGELGSGKRVEVRSFCEPWDTVIMLPTAAVAPVVNLPRRGRRPRNVTHIRRGQELRAENTRRTAELQARQ